MINGQRLTLRPWNEGDLAFFQRLRNDVETQIELLAVPRPNPMHRVRKWLEDRSSAFDGVFFVIADIDNDSAIGFIELREIHAVHGWGSLGICLGRDARGKGFASHALELMESYARRVLMLRKIVLNVASTNDGARRLYESAGYRTVGIHHQHYHAAGEWLDAIVMEKGLNAEEPQPEAATTSRIDGQHVPSGGVRHRASGQRLATS